MLVMSAKSFYDDREVDIALKSGSAAIEFVLNDDEMEEELTKEALEYYNNIVQDKLWRALL